jgi:hypothetical protein
VKRLKWEALGVGEQGIAKIGEQKKASYTQVFRCYEACNTLIGFMDPLPLK